MKKTIAAVLLLMLLSACSTGTPESPSTAPSSAVETPSATPQASSLAPRDSEPDAEIPDRSDGAPTDDSQAVNPMPEDASQHEVPTGGKALVVYFSHTGTTETVANIVADTLGADLFQIEPVIPYSAVYSETLALAQQELSDSARPAIVSTVANMADYDTILIGYPIWHGTYPMVVATFVESHDLSGKTIAPFCTSGSTAISRSVSDLAELLTDADIAPGLGLTSSTVGNAETSVQTWLAQLDLV